MSLEVRGVSTDPAEETWVDDLRDPDGAGREAALALREVLLRATRHQVRRLRTQLPGAGPIQLEDLAQQAADDALVAVLRRLDSFEGRSRFTTWAYKFGILHGGAIVRKQAWRHREVPLPDRLTVAATSASPAGVVEGHDLAEAIRTAIDQGLTPHQRHVALALLVEGVPIDVLAERLGSNRNALYKTLHDARQRLRARLADEGYLDDTPGRSTR